MRQGSISVLVRAVMRCLPTLSPSAIYETLRVQMRCECGACHSTGTKTEQTVYRCDRRSREAGAATTGIRTLQCLRRGCASAPWRNTA